MKKLTPEKLDELHAKALPRVTHADLLTVTKGEFTSEDKYALDTYLSKFVKPQTNDAGKHTCVGCDHVIRGGIEGFMLGGAPDSCTMEWGLAHGECFCSNCGWPARAYHFDVGPIKRMEIVLQYHPDGISIRNPERVKA